MKLKIGIGMTTCSSVKTAKLLVQRLLQTKLVARGQIEKEMDSYYHWNGKTEVSRETRIVLKFIMGNEDAIEKVLLNEHEYDTPQWVYWEAEGSKDYINWVNNPK